jgi:hypothetical protein
MGGGGGQLIIKTDHQSLKYMMTQRLSGGIQHKLLMRLLEFNYSIEYKRGKENAVADALSRMEHSVSIISTMIPAWITDIESSYVEDATYTNIIQQLNVNDQSQPHYTIHYGILRYKGKVCIGSTTDLRLKILSSLHSSAIGGHSGMRATCHRVKRNFHWPNLKASVESFVSECPICQRAKSKQCHYPGLLAPLPIPHMA